MANSTFNFNIRIFSFVFLFCFSFLSNVVSSHAHAISTNNLASSICPKTRNPPFCARVLKSAGNIDMKALATYTLNLAHTNVGKSLALVKSLASKTTNSQLKKRYLSCSENYDEAMGDIENAEKYLAIADFNGVNIATSGVMTTVDDCQDNFKQLPIDTSLLPKNGRTLNDICSIILVISNLLPKPI